MELRRPCACSQMVELRETGNIVVDMARMGANSAGGQQKANGGLINPAQQKKPPELKATLYTWRERLPNKWDALKQWDDIFCWRNEVLGLAWLCSCLCTLRLFALPRSL